MFKLSQQPKPYDQQKEQNEPLDDSSRMQTVHMSMFSRASKHSKHQRIRETSTVFQWPSHSAEHCSLGSWDLANQAHHSNSKHVNLKISKDCVGRRMRIKSTQFRMANGPLPHFVHFLHWPDRLLPLSYFHRWPQRNGLKFNWINSTQKCLASFQHFALQFSRAASQKFYRFLKGECW